MLNENIGFKVAQSFVALTGSAVFLIGLSKALSHTFSASGFVICGSGAASQSAFLSLSSSAHCWGCPVALSGLLVVGAAATFAPSKDNKKGQLAQQNSAVL